MTVAKYLWYSISHIKTSLMEKRLGIWSHDQYNKTIQIHTQLVCLSYDCLIYTSFSAQLYFQIIPNYFNYAYYFHWTTGLGLQGVNQCSINYDKNYIKWERVIVETNTITWHHGSVINLIRRIKAYQICAWYKINENF